MMSEIPMKGSNNRMSNDLNSLKSKIDKYTETKLEKVTYNIFEVVSVIDKEVIMCRMLADLLNPKGKHNNGIKYLNLFFQKVLPGQFDSEELLKKTEVIKEYKIPGIDRRIDIVIKNKNQFIPIEVKINAQEQKSQCYDYLKHAKRKFPDTKIVYLTKYGTKPSAYSTVGTEDDPGVINQDDIILISFEEHIIDWLQEIVKNETGELRYAINQYLNSIKEFTHTMDKKLYEDLAKDFLKSKKELVYGIQISEAVSVAKAEVLKNVLKKIEEAIDKKVNEEENNEIKVWKKYQLEKEKKFFWYTFDKKANADFYKISSTFPGINYVVNSVKLPDGLELWFRVEVEHNLFAGYCVFDPKANKGHGGEKIIDEKLKEKLKEVFFDEFSDDEIKTGKWWAKWKYLPKGEVALDESVPNFKEMNEAALCLADPDKLNDFVKECMDIIENNFLLSLKMKQ